MTSHEAPGVDLLARLEKRRDFLRCARGRKAVRRAFVLQMAAQPEPPGRTPGLPAVRVGFTATRKIGKAVARNRAKRRLRAASRAVMPGRVLPGHDYVLVARGAVLTCDFATLERDLESALAEVTRRPSLASPGQAADGSAQGSTAA